MKKDLYHHGNLKEELINISFDVIKNEGIENLTLKKLSEKTGTSRSAIYRHFKSKEDLVETILLSGFDQFDSIIAPIFCDKKMDLLDRFYKSGRLYIEFAKENPNLYKLIFGKRYSHIRESLRSINNDECLAFNALKNALIEGQESGVFKKFETQSQAIVIWASLHGISSILINGFMDVEIIYEEIYKTMFENLKMSLLKV